VRLGPDDGSIQTLGRVHPAVIDVGRGNSTISCVAMLRVVSGEELPAGGPARSTVGPLAIHTEVSCS
jgi:hypothetical protein